VPEVDRRRFLAGIGAAAGAGALRTLGVPARAAAADAPFAWGVASFDPTASSVLLWTRVEPPAGAAAVELRWTLASDAALTSVVASGRADAEAAHDHTVRVAVDDLPPGRTWWYAFETTGGDRSTVGRTRTLDPASTRTRVAVVSCSRFASGGFAGYRAVAARDVDVVLHVGDYVYEDGQGGVRPHVPARRCTTLADYRARYAQHRADPDLQALHASHPVVAVWDDHEVAGNAWRDGAASHDDARDGPWAARLAAASQAYAEWVPGRTKVGTDGRLQTWRAQALSDRVELVVLDTRHWGRDRQPATAAELADASSPRQLLGRDQEAFVSSRLTGRERRPWVLLANQVMLHPLRIPVPTSSLAAAAQRGGFLVSGGRALNPDQWDGYPWARERLVRAVGTDGGVVALTGDVHSSWAWEGPARNGADEPTMVELVTPSLTSESFAKRIPAPSSMIELGLVASEPDLSHVEVSSHGYLLLDLTEDRLQAEWWYVDPADPSTQRFDAGRAAPRTPPMLLTEASEPTADRDPDGSGPRATAGASTGGSSSGDDDGVSLPLVGAGALAAAAAVGGLVAVRSRRRRHGGEQGVELRAGGGGQELGRTGPEVDDELHGGPGRQG
jgi:phosphodiesterase/alkaline phosphatase D-like protein